jgi:hypothetical protein
VKRLLSDWADMAGCCDCERMAEESTVELRRGCLGSSEVSDLFKRRHCFLLARHLSHGDSLLHFDVVSIMICRLAG